MSQENQEAVVGNEWAYFEALDRTHMVRSHLESALKSHPAIQRHPELMELYEQAAAAVDELYFTISQYSC